MTLFETARTDVKVVHKEDDRQRRNKQGEGHGPKPLQKPEVRRACASSAGRGSVWAAAAEAHGLQVFL